MLDPNGVAAIPIVASSEPPPPPPPPGDPLYVWARGYLAGYDTGHEHGRAAGHDEHHSRCEPFYEQLVHQAGRVSERAGRAKDWREAVIRGLCP